MFTGIIEEIGHVKSLHRGAKSFTLEVEADVVMQGTQVGDSIATNGVCLTVTSLTGHGFTADVMPETVQRTALGELKAGSPVNLERALSLQTRLGGHIVSGHIDGTGRIADRRQDDTALWLTVECDSRLLRYVIEKGSITIQGVSLTVARVDERSFAVSLIPHTQSATTLHAARIGDLVNLENDIIAKYVEKLLGKAPSDESILKKLAENGF
ncbi:MAG: riboflavin synthase [Bacteroidales bacterium]|jgi:riboflavin synthase|nr:riboflavin synthase [Bacteroidales bacterium]